MMQRQIYVAPKRWWASKTIWVSILTFIIGLLGFLAGQDFVTNHPQLPAFIAMALGILNVLLRFVTGRPIAVGRNR